MLFNVQSLLILGLVAVSNASPIANPDADAGALVARAQIPAHGVNCGGEIFTYDEINKAKNQANFKGLQTSGYPKEFGNKVGQNWFFENHKKSLVEFVLIHGATAYNSGEPGKYRIVLNKVPSGTYVGAMYHPIAASSSFLKCTPVEAPAQAPAHPSAPPAAPAKTPTPKKPKTTKRAL